MKTFEYLTATTTVDDSKETDNWLNEHGRGGWDLVSIVSVEYGKAVFFFKRERGQ